MINIPKINRPNKEIVEKIKNLGSATVSGTLYGMGISNPFIMGPTTKTPGKSIAGPAITLQFLPKREDIYNEDEYSCLLYTSPSPRDVEESRMPSSA